jgi:ABC-type dipeptide/oligopeptide/nickel transport system permease subunit
VTAQAAGGRGPGDSRLGSGTGSSGTGGSGSLLAPRRNRRAVLAARFRLAARRDPVGCAAAVGALALVLVALLAPLLPIPAPASLVGQGQLGPSSQHLFGTDQLGRDVLSRIIWGARHTLVTAALSTALATVIGTPLGILAGYLARWPSGLVMRIMDVLLAFPGLLLALVVVTVLGPGVTTVVIAVGVSYTPIFARVVYGPTRSVRAQDYIAAARAVGCSPLRIVRRHVFPVLASEIIVVVSSAIGWTTLLAATLDFLGFGIRPPAPDWGADLSAGVQYLSQAWWISAAPGIAITITILLANYLGDFLASMTDPDRLRQPRSKIKDTTTLIAGDG